MMKLLTRPERRAISRELARRDAAYNGPSPRYEPAVGNPTCPDHHRALPCSRCAA